MTLADIRLGLRAFLLSDAAIAATVGDRIYPNVLEQGIKHTSIVYSRISGLGDHWMQGPTGLNRPRYQIDCWSLAPGDASALADLVKEHLDGYRGPMPYGTNSPQDFITVQGVFFTDERDDFDTESQMFRMSRDYFIWFREF